MAHVINIHNAKKSIQMAKQSQNEIIVPPIWALGKPDLAENIVENTVMESSILTQTDFIFKEMDEQWQGETDTDHSYGSNTACK